ncbi:MAG TPA: hypothetical protein VJI15_04945 [Candidatus Nanoarchaeia archaeon]|nr:hypothetical protein [Candidatus Nanoarchaeia archaeon]
MDRRLPLVIILLIILSPSVLSLDAESYSAEYTIVADKVIVEEKYDLGYFTSELTLVLPSDATAIEVNGLEFQVIDLNLYKNVIISGPLFNTVSIKYITKAYVEKTKDSFFIVNYNVNTRENTITAHLPESATLKYSTNSPQRSVIPHGEITTDGKSLSIEWQNVSAGEALLVIYNTPREIGEYWKTIGIMMAVGIIILGIFYLTGKRKKRKADDKDNTKDKEDEDKKEYRHQKKDAPNVSDVTRNLFEEEKAIVEVLLQKGELWQKQLVLHTGISKVKLSRKLRNLEAKGIIEKVPYGNTNKIRLKSRATAE